MSYTARHRGYQLKQRPKQYPMTRQQRVFIRALSFCGIKKGISKADLMDKMRNCIPEYFRSKRDGDKDLHG